MDIRTKAIFELAVARAIVGAVIESAPQTADSLCEHAGNSGIAPNRCRDIVNRLIRIGVLLDSGSSLGVDLTRARESGLV